MNLLLNETGTKIPMTVITKGVRILDELKSFSAGVQYVSGWGLERGKRDVSKKGGTNG